MQAVITAYMMGFALSQLFTGFLSDRYGRRKVLLVGVVIYTIASVFTAIAGDFTHLLGGAVYPGPRLRRTARDRHRLGSRLL